MGISVISELFLFSLNYFIIHVRRGVEIEVAAGAGKQKQSQALDGL